MGGNICPGVVFRYRERSVAKLVAGRYEFTVYKGQNRVKKYALFAERNSTQFSSLDIDVYDYKKRQLTNFYLQEIKNGEANSVITELLLLLDKQSS